MSFPNSTQAISYSTNLQTVTKGDKYFLSKAIFQAGVGLTDDVAFGKLALAINTYMNTNFELENGVPASGFNFFISFSCVHDNSGGGHTDFFALITVFYNTVEKIYTQ
jgi:hypothetical protein